MTQAGWLRSEWGASEHNRRARYYAITAAGRKQLADEENPSPPPEQQIEATIDSVSPNCFRVMGVPLIRGSFFDGHETRDNTPVMLINETMARRFWPGEDVVGKRFKFGDASSDSPWRTVVGVVGDMRRQGMERVA